MIPLLSSTELATRVRSTEAGSPKPDSLLTLSIRASDACSPRLETYLGDHARRSLLSRRSIKPSANSKPRQPCLYSHGATCEDNSLEIDLEVEKAYHRHDVPIARHLTAYRIKSVIEDFAP